MKLLLTGASGFLGKIIKNTLNKNEVISLARSNADINIDLTINVPQLPYVDIVIHSAGKAHSVPKTKKENLEFYTVNVDGTANLLRGLENSYLPKSFVFISTVAVYGKESGTLIDENTSLLAKDPYGHSKIQAEKLIKKWCEKNNVICSVLRLPLIAGPNPPGNLKSMINGIKKGYYFNIAGGNAKKSIVLAEDVAHIILKAAKLGGTYNLTDNYHPSFYELSLLISAQLNKKPPLNISYNTAKLLALMGDLIGQRSPVNSNKLKKITLDLTFDDSKARNLLGWEPNNVLKKFNIYNN